MHRRLEGTEMGATLPTARDAILIVDARGGVVRPMEPALEQAGYAPVHASTALEALATSRLVRPLVVAVDSGLAGAAGLCRQLVSDPLAGQPVVVQIRAEMAPVDAPPAEREHDVHRDGPANGSVEVLALDDEVVGRLDGLARHARAIRSVSPLTGLPGNAAIRAELDRRLADRVAVGLLYADLDSFKPYNDHYGFLRGDAVLRAFADVLRDVARTRPGTFVGHIGGDDFAVLAEEPEEIADEVIGSFRQIAPTFYDDRDRRRGWIPGRDRRGRRLRWPLLSVSIGLACSQPELEHDALALVDRATEMKSVAKRNGGNSIAIDRRSVSGGPRRVRRVGGLPWSPREIAGRVASVVAALLLVGALGLPATVALAGTAGPEDRLWSVRVETEQMRVRMARTPRQRAVVHLDIAADRLGHLIVRSPEGAQMEVLLDDLASHLDAAQGALLGVSETMADDVLAALEQQTALVGALADHRCAAGRSVACSALGQTAAALGARTEVAPPRAGGAPPTAQEHVPATPRSGPGRTGAGGPPAVGEEVPPSRQVPGGRAGAPGRVDGRGVDGRGVDGRARDGRGQDTEPPRRQGSDAPAQERPRGRSAPGGGTPTDDGAKDGDRQRTGRAAETGSQPEGRVVTPGRGGPQAPPPGASEVD